MITADYIQTAHFPTDTVSLVGDAASAAWLAGALAASKHLDLNEKFEYQFFNSQPEIGNSTYQCIFKPKKGGADFISDPSLWKLSDGYVVTNELEAIA